MAHSLKVVGVCVLLFVAVLSVGCATRPDTIPTNIGEKPCDDCIKGVKNFARVTPHLWRGAQPTPEGFCNLKANGVKTIVNLRHDHDDFPFLGCTNLRYFWIKARAWHPEEKDLVKILKVLEDKDNWPVFVHCAAGSDRTGYSIATYRIVEQKWTADDAIHEMFAFRYHPWWFMNPKALRDIEKDKEVMQKKVSEVPSPAPDNAGCLTTR